MVLLSVKNLNIQFKYRKDICTPVNDVSFVLDKNDSLGIVGESGAGKSLACYSLLGLLPFDKNNKIITGEAAFKELNLLKLSEQELQQIRGKDISIVFQDPMTSLNPYLKIGTQIIESYVKHHKVSKNDARMEALKLLTDVGIQEPLKCYNQYPYECSGGMRQRIMIAAALITNPEILIADEPTTALDVIIQAQILNLLKELRNDFAMSIILITHDLGVVSELCEKICIMYAGKILEYGTTDEIMLNPKHPYTIALKKSIPDLDRTSQKLYTIPGMPPDITQKTKGCPFAPRCSKAKKECFELDKIEYRELSKTQKVACILC